MEESISEFDNWYVIPNNFTGKCKTKSDVSTRFRYYVNGKIHRLDGPAIEHASGSKYWFKEDLRHRLDGPAIEDCSGYKEWYKEGKTHRLDGPAKEYPGGARYWYVEGKRYTEEAFDALPEVIMYKAGLEMFI